MRRFLVLALGIGLAGASASGVRAQPTPDAGAPTVGEPAVPTFSPPIRTIPIPPRVERPEVINPRNRGGRFPQGSRGPRPADPLVAPLLGGGGEVTVETFLGMSRELDGSLLTPPDVMGDVGPGHYVQVVNGGVEILDKTGTVLVGPLPLSTFWQGTPPCNVEAGDVVVVYDELADRWLLAQFASGNGVCVAVSQTADPADVYALYHFTNASFPDYPKIGVWPTAYFAGYNAGGATAVAYERDAMLAGQPARQVSFNLFRNYLLPADHDGTEPPPDGAPGLFYTMMDDEYWPGQGIPGPDRLELYAFDVDWTDPGLATFEMVTELETAPFNYTVCGWFNFDCARQPGTGQRLDVVSEWPMWRAAYRRVGDAEVIVGSFAVDASGNEQGGVRWFELRGHEGVWSLHQEGTLAPDADSRFLSAAAMNADGVIALGYAVSSTTTFPSLRVAYRLPDDPLGQLRDEVPFAEGGGVQTGSNRFGDYFALSVDPADDRTFWFTGEYYRATSSTGWATEIGTIAIEAIPPTAAEGTDPGGGGFRMSTPYPNPSVTAATVTVTVEEAQHVRAELVGTLGRRVALVFDGPLAAGERQLRVPVAGLPAGLYVLRVQGEWQAVTRRLLVVR